MHTIYKYEIDITDRQTLRLPVGAQIIHAGLDPKGTPCVWAEVNNTIVHEHDHTIYVVGTGNPRPNGARKHLGSFTHGGSFVWHIYKGYLPPNPKPKFQVKEIRY